MRDEACKVPQDVIRPLDLGASRYNAIFEEANSAALINLSLMHYEGYSNIAVYGTSVSDIPRTLHLRIS